jgi:hypothetical protein
MLHTSPTPTSGQRRLSPPENVSKQPEVQAHMKQAAALAISFNPVDYDLSDVALAE